MYFKQEKSIENKEKNKEWKQTKKKIEKKKGLKWIWTPWQYRPYRLLMSRNVKEKVKKLLEKHIYDVFIFLRFRKENISRTKPGSFLFNISSSLRQYKVNFFLFLLLIYLFISSFKSLGFENVMFWVKLASKMGMFPKIDCFLSDLIPIWKNKQS